MELTRKQFDILTFLEAKTDQIITQREIATEI